MNPKLLRELARLFRKEARATRSSEEKAYLHGVSDRISDDVAEAEIAKEERKARAA